MLISTLILIFSLALLMFYLQTLSESILRREFAQPYFRAIAERYKLEFLQVGSAFQSFSEPADVARSIRSLSCDYQVLSYLLKHTGTREHRFTMQDRLIAVYARLAFLRLGIERRWGRSEKAPGQKLASVVKYFANRLGECTLAPAETSARA